MASTRSSRLDRSKPFGPGFTYVNGLHGNTHRDSAYLRLYNSGDYDHIPRSIRPYYILSVMRDGLCRSTLKRARSLEELSPVSSAASAGTGRVDDMEEAPLRKRRRTSSLCSEHSALEEAEQLTDEGQIHLGVPIREDVGGMRRDEEEASFESPLSQVTRPSFLAVLSSSEEATRPALDTVMEGDEIDVHAAQSSHSQVSESSPSVMSLGSETSEASTPVEGSESEEESAGIGEAVEALEGNSEQSSTRSTDEEVLMEEVEVHGGEEHSEEAEVMEDESEMQELDMDNAELLPAHESEIGKPDATHDEEYSDGEEEEEEEGAKTPTADSLLEYKAVEDTNLIESSSESLQFSPDEEVESPLGSGPIEWDHSPTSSGGLPQLDEPSSQQSQSEELEILGSEPAEDEANDEGSTAEEHYDHEGRVEERSGVLDDAGGDREAVDAMEPPPIPMSATGRPLRRAAIAALEEIHAEAASNTRPHHFHSASDAADFQDEHGQMAEEEYSPMKTSPRRRSPRKGNKAEASTESVSMAMNPSSAGVVSMMSSEDKEASVQSPTGSALANEGSIVEDLSSLPASSVQSVPVTPAPRRTPRGGGRLTQISCSPTVRRTTRASALEAMDRIHSIAVGRDVAHASESGGTSDGDRMEAATALLEAIGEDHARAARERSSRESPPSKSMKSRDLHVPPSIDPPIHRPVTAEKGDNESLASSSVRGDVEKDVEGLPKIRHSARLQAKAQADSSAPSSSNTSPERRRKSRSSATSSSATSEVTPTKARKRPASTVAAKSKTKSKRGRLAAIPEEPQTTKRPTGRGGRNAG